MSAKRRRRVRQATPVKVRFLLLSSEDSCGGHVLVTFARCFLGLFLFGTSFVLRKFLRANSIREIHDRGKELLRTHAPEDSPFLFRDGNLYSARHAQCRLP